MTGTLDVGRGRGCPRAWEPTPPPSGGLEGGLYESEYVKEGGDGTWKWKLFRHRYFPF